MMTQTIPDGLDHVGDVYRPPAEADSILIQGAVGCSHNKCTFCGAYVRKKFRLKDRETLERDLVFAERYCQRQDRVFVLDGNALAMPVDRWVWLLENIRQRLPWVTGAAAFATGMDIAAKSDAELSRLRSLGLDRLYVGVESGHAEVLSKVRKGIDPEGLRRQCLRARAAGFALCISVVLGIADDDVYMESAKRTGKLISAINPEEIGITMLVPQPGTIFRKDIKDGTSPPPSRDRLLRELREFYVHTDLDGGLFNGGHSSSYISFKARMPEEKAVGLACIDRALAGETALKADALRHI